MWGEARTRYVIAWRSRGLAAEAKSLDEMASLLRAAADKLDAMRRDGVVLDEGEGADDDYVLLVTTDPAIAEKYGMIDESEYWDIDRQRDDPSSLNEPEQR